MSSRVTILEYKPFGDPKAGRVMTPSAFDIGGHKGHLAADIMVCLPRSHVIYI